MLGLCGVSAGYGSFQALFEVSLSVAAGEAVGVIGPQDDLDARKFGSPPDRRR
jgi:ABC-type branched-subunit amino acid transport system ATPase component